MCRLRAPIWRDSRGEPAAATLHSLYQLHGCSKVTWRGRTVCGAGGDLAFDVNAAVELVGAGKVIAHGLIGGRDVPCFDGSGDRPVL